MELKYKYLHMMEYYSALKKKKEGTPAICDHVDEH